MQSLKQGLKPDKGVRILLMEEQIRYIQKYLNIDSCHIDKNYGLIYDSMFCKRETNLQNGSEADTMYRSEGRALGADRMLIRQPIYDRLNTPPVNRFEYPEGKEFAVCLTHDVDYIYPPFSHTILSSLSCIKNMDINRLKEHLFWKDKGREFSPYRNFEEIMGLEERYDAKSSFYFMATDKTDKDITRFRYDIEDIESELRLIVDNGWEVGLHGGYYTYNNLEYMQSEKKRLESVLGKRIIGYRNHYLMFKPPDTWELLAKAGFRYDATLGYNDMVGFRNGLCHPFKPFNINTDKEINVLEIPLVVMDSALFNFTSSFDTAWNTVKELIDTTKRYNGVFTILWHNDGFNRSFRDTWINIYDKTLSYCSENNAWITSGEEIFKWWDHKYHDI